MKEWIFTHYILSAMLFYVLIQAAYILILRTFRLITILIRGYPENKNMDADGDIVLNKENK